MWAKGRSNSKEAMVHPSSKFTMAGLCIPLTNVTMGRKKKKKSKKDKDKLTRAITEGGESPQRVHMIEKTEAEKKFEETQRKRVSLNACWNDGLDT